MVFDLLPSRQVVLDVASLLPEGVPLKIMPLSSNPSLGNSSNPDLDSPSERLVYSRAALEYYRALAEVRQDVADDGETSSEDEAFPVQAPLRLKAKGFSSSDPAAFDIRAANCGSASSVGRGGGGGGNDNELESGDDPRLSAALEIFVVDTLAPEVDPVSNDEFDDAANRNAASIVSPLISSSIDDRRYKNMLKRHKKKRRKKPCGADPNYRPDLDTAGIDLNDVISRTEMSLATADDD